MLLRLATPAGVFAGFVVFFAFVFGPVLFSGNFMTSGDGVVQAIPTYFGRTPLIEPKLMLGYPLFADPNQAFWYPVLRIARSIPGAFNAYALFPYPVVAFGTYGFARRVSGSQAGAIAAGVIVALGGFMISHQGHLMIIHPACWAPYVLWAFAQLRDSSNRSTVALGSVAFALALMAGTQQPALYLVLIACAYAVVFQPRERARKIAFFRDVAVVVFAGLALAAVALVPAAEFALRSDRIHQSLLEFSVFSTGSLEFAIRSFFPYLLGGSASASYLQPFPRIGAYTEATNYAGLLSLLLGIIALLDRTVRRRAMFWFGVAIWSAWMALGPELGAATIARLIPFYGSFRIPGRHAFEWTFAIAILASLGIAAVESARVPWRNALISIGTIAGIFAVALCVVLFDEHALLALMAPGIDVASIPPLTLETDRALAIPLVVLVGACLVLALSTRLSVTIFRVLVVTSIACDMLVFAYGSYWHDYATPKAILNPPLSVAHLRDSLQRNGGRYIDLGSLTSRSVMPNLATLWQLSDATGYVSLEDQSFEGFFNASPVGIVPSDNGLITALDLTGVRFLLLPPDPPAHVPIAAALAGEPLDGFIGDAAIAPERNLTLALSNPQIGDELQLVTALGNAVAIPNRAHVADVIANTPHGTLTFPLLAGVDTSESAYDRPDVHAQMKHARAKVFSGTNDAQLYITKLKLPVGTIVRSVSVDWVDRATHASALTVTHIALLDDSRSIAYPFYADGRFTEDASHFIERGDVYRDGSERVLENRRAFPHAWVANETIVATPDVELDAIRAGRLEDRIINFHHTALVREPVSLGASARDDRVTVVSSEPTFESDTVTCANTCMLVTNDLWYPGWDASIDGVRAPVLPVDYALRGVAVPAGSHRVELWFAPLSLRIGIAISLCAAIFVIGTLALGVFASPSRRNADDAIE